MTTANINLASIVTATIAIVIATLLSFSYSTQLLAAETESSKEDWEFYDRTKTIHLKFTDAVKDGYDVSVTWTPDGGLPLLTGPAMINFNSADWSESFTFYAEHFHIPYPTLKELGFFRGERGFNLSIDLNKTYPIEYGSFTKTSLWGDTLTIDSLTGEIVPFFFEDVDLDGQDDLVVKGFRAGQRWADTFTVYEAGSKWGQTVYTQLTSGPFADIDTLTRFDKDNQTISLYSSSGGFCSGSLDVYKKVAGEFSYVLFKEWQYIEREGEGKHQREHCQENNYDIVDGKQVLRFEQEPATETPSDCGLLITDLMQPGSLWMLTR